MLESVEAFHNGKQVAIIQIQVEITLLATCLRFKASNVTVGFSVNVILPNVYGFVVN